MESYLKIRLKSCKYFVIFENFRTNLRFYVFILVNVNCAPSLIVTVFITRFFVLVNKAYCKVQNILIVSYAYQHYRNPSPSHQWYVNLYVNLLDLFIFTFSLKNCIFVYLKICIFHVIVNLKKPILDFGICPIFIQQFYPHFLKLNWIELNRVACIFIILKTQKNNTCFNQRTSF